LSGADALIASRRSPSWSTLTSSGGLSAALAARLELLDVRLQLDARRSETRSTRPTCPPADSRDQGMVGSLELSWRRMSGPNRRLSAIVRMLRPAEINTMIRRSRQ